MAFWNSQALARGRPANHLARRLCGFTLVTVAVILMLLGGYARSEPIKVSASEERQVSFNYGEALEKAILFFENQRSGKLPQSQRVPWRGDSGLADGQDVGVDLVGGYYDAGDNVKFGVPMAFTATLLSWAITQYGDQLESLGQLQYAEEALKWNTDYLLKAITGPTELWVQVGDADADHACWERPEDMDTSRMSYKIDEQHPGTEPAAETAAALAAASKIFAQTNPEYSTKLLEQAHTMFNFANMYQSSYGDACPYYCSFSGFQDELLWAAAWLYEATSDQYYLDYVIDHKSLSVPSVIFSWDDKFVGAQILLAKHFLSGNQALDIYKTHADAFICAILPSSPERSVDLTPGGLLFIEDDNNVHYVSTSAFLLAIYSDMLTEYGTNVNCQGTEFEPHSLYSFAKSQVDYLLGFNPLGMSYMVGYSDFYPKQSHHRGASIVSTTADPERITCQEGYTDWYNKDEANPNTLIGAIVGPDESDEFSDKRADFLHLESTTYINAPFVGLLAKIAST